MTVTLRYVIKKSDKLPMSSSLDSSSDEEEYITPKKRSYRRALYHGRGKVKRKMDLDSPDNVEKIEDHGSSSGFPGSDHSSLHDDISISEHGSSDVSIDNSFQDQSDISDLSDNSENDASIIDDNIETDEELENCNKDDTLYDGAQHTMFTSYVSIMLFAMKHSLSRTAFSDLLILLKTHMPKESKLTTSVYKLKEFLKSSIGFQQPIKHFLCDTCGMKLVEGEHCTKPTCTNARMFVFHDLRLEKQLSQLFKDETFRRLIIMKQQDCDTGICSEEYKRLHRLPKIDAAEVNITFTMNTDGVALFSSSNKGNLWPVYLAVNELPARLRFSKKYLLTTHLFCQAEKPNMLTYLKPLMESLKKLHSEGLSVQTSAGRLFVRCHLSAVTVDLPARAMVLNMKQFNGRYGCCYCEDEGCNPPNRPTLRYYPYVSEAAPRQHGTMSANARTALETGEPVKGIKGPNPAMILKYIDMPKTFVIDWMHSVLLGVVKTVLSMWCDTNYKGRAFYIGDKMALMNQRLLGIKPPDFIIRQQRPMDDYKHWKASECREWLLHYSIPVVSGIQNSEITIHFALLVTAMFLLNQEEVTEADLNVAEKCLNGFCQMFPTFYVVEKQTMNIHMLRHLMKMVTLHGPLYNYSCFGFESMNSHLKNMVHGTRFVNDQICFAVGMTKCLPELVKTLMGEANCSVKLLLQQLSKNLISNDDNIATTKTLGALKVHNLSQAERAQMVPGNFQKCHRAQTKIRVLYSEDYDRTKKRHSYSVQYVDGGLNRYGKVKYFLTGGGAVYAIINEYQTSELTLLDYTNAMQELMVHQNVCPHMKQVVSVERDNPAVVPVSQIKAKCIYMSCQRNRAVISVPPNTLEHN